MCIPTTHLQPRCYLLRIIYVIQKLDTNRISLYQKRIFAAESPGSPIFITFEGSANCTENLLFLLHYQVRIEDF